MTVVESPVAFGHLGRLADNHGMMMERQSNEILQIKSCYLPTLVTSQEEVNSASLKVSQQRNNQEVKQTHNEFKSRLRPSIYKGNCPSFAMDPEQHVQLIKEREAMLQQRCRPKSPINLEPVHILSLSQPKARKAKAKNQRLTRSAPELMQHRNTKQELSSHATKANTSKVQLPLLTAENNTNLAELIGANSTVQGAKRLTNSASGLGPDHPIYDINTSPLEPKLQVVTATKLNQLKPMRHSKGNAKLLKNSQSNYAALREQRLLSEKLRAFDSENLLVDAQKYRQHGVDSVLDMVEQAQSQLRCPKTNGRRSCGICPPTAGVVRKGRINSASLPELSLPAKEEVSKVKKELVVQLPNITYSRANTPAATSVVSCRSARPSAVGGRLVVNRHHVDGEEENVS